MMDEATNPLRIGVIGCGAIAQLSHIPYITDDERFELVALADMNGSLLNEVAEYFLHFPSPVIIQGCQGELAWEKKVIVSYEEAFHNELRAFYDNVQNNKEPQTTVSDALKHIRFVYQVIDALNV